MISSTRLALLFALQLAAGATLFACGSDDAGGDDDEDKDVSAADAGGGSRGDSGQSSGGGGGDNGGLSFSFSPLYSAFVEGHESTVPLLIKDTSQRGMGAHFTSSDESIATVTDNNDGAMVTVKKEGTVTIKGTLGSDSGSVKLTITKFTEAQWKAGQDRFSKMELAIPADASGKVNLLNIRSGMQLNKNGACTTCHTSQGKTLLIENGPLQTARYTDNELITIFTMGKKPDGAAARSDIPPFLWGMFHTWQVTEEEKQGLVAYIRTQQPKAQPPIKYGVQLCPGAMITGMGIPPLCDDDGKPVNIDGGTATGATDAGAATTADAGTATGDAG